MNPKHLRHHTQTAHEHASRRASLWRAFLHWLLSETLNFPANLPVPTNEASVLIAFVFALQQKLSSPLPPALRKQRITILPPRPRGIDIEISIGGEIFLIEVKFDVRSLGRTGVPANCSAIVARYSRSDPHGNCPVITLDRIFHEVPCTSLTVLIAKLRDQFPTLAKLQEALGCRKLPPVEARGTASAGLVKRIAALAQAKGLPVDGDELMQWEIRPTAPALTYTSNVTTIVRRIGAAEIAAALGLHASTPHKWRSHIPAKHRAGILRLASRVSLMIDDSVFATPDRNAWSKYDNAQAQLIIAAGGATHLSKHTDLSQQEYSRYATGKHLIPAERLVQLITIVEGRGGELPERVFNRHELHRLVAAVGSEKIARALRVYRRAVTDWVHAGRVPLWARDGVAALCEADGILVHPEIFGRRPCGVVAADGGVVAELIGYFRPLMRRIEPIGVSGVRMKQFQASNSIPTRRKPAFKRALRKLGKKWERRYDTAFHGRR